MSAELPTEEDVLAALLWWWLSEEDADCPDFYRAVQSPVSDVAYYRWRNLGMPQDLRVAIADSERRLEVEQARDAVVEAARIWDGQNGLGNLDRCLGALHDAERALEGK